MSRTIRIGVPTAALDRLASAERRRLGDRIAALAAVYHPSGATVELASAAGTRVTVTTEDGATTAAPAPSDPADIDGLARSAMRALAARDAREPAAWGNLTALVAPPWVAIEPGTWASLGARLWNTRGVPMPPLAIAADAALVPGEVRLAIDGRVITAITAAIDPLEAVSAAVLAAAHRWLTTPLVSTLFDLTVPLETRERFTAAIPLALQAGLVTRLVADQVSVRDLVSVAESGLGVVLGIRMSGIDVGAAAANPRIATDWLDALEMTARIAIRRTISMQLLESSRTEVVVVATARAGAADLSAQALAAAITRVGGGGPRRVLAVPAPIRRRIRDLLDGWFDDLPVVAAEELIAAPWQGVATIGDDDLAG